MNIDVNMCSETFQTPENQQSLASAFLDVETNEMNKDHVLAQFLHNTHVDNKKKAKERNKSNSKEMFENASVSVKLKALGKTFGNFNVSMNYNNYIYFHVFSHYELVVTEFASYRTKNYF
jgi:hypothetical protein